METRSAHPRGMDYLEATKNRVLSNPGPLSIKFPLNSLLVFNSRIKYFFDTLKNSLSHMKKLLFVFGIAIFGFSSQVYASTMQASLSNETPRGTNIPYNSTAIPFTTIELTASDDADVEISSITFTRLGLGDIKDFTDVWLELDGKQVPGTSQLKSTNNNDQAELTFSPPILIPAGQTLIADLFARTKPISNGHHHRFVITLSNDIKSSALNISGNFPLEGEEMAVSSYTVTPIQFSPLGNDSTINAGDTEVEIGRFSLKNNTDTSKDLELRAITFKNTGTAKLEEVLKNAVLHTSEGQISAKTSIYGDTITFYLDNDITGGYILEDGISLNFNILADIVSAQNGSTIQLKLESFIDIIAREIGTGFGARTVNTAAETLKTYTIQAKSSVATKEPEEEAAENNPEAQKETQAISPNQPPAATVKEESAKVFSDIPSHHPNYKAIKFLKEKSVISGYEDGSFQPERTVNRAELLKIIVASKNLELDSTQYQNCFPDVSTQWFAPFVCYAKHQGWVKGYPDGTFKPAQTVSKAESIKMLLEAYGEPLPSVEQAPFEDVETNTWFAPYIARAKAQGYLEETSNTFEPGQGHRRGGIAENLYRLLQN